MKFGIDKLILRSSLSVFDAFNLINENGLSACFIVNEKGEMVGIVTDGDLRKSIVRGVKFEVKISEIMNTNFVYAYIEDPISKINSLFNDQIKIIPLLNENKIPIDYATISRIRFLPIYEPVFNGNELSYVSECIQTGWISSQGRFVKLFEKKFSEYLNSGDAVAVSNGTNALHLALVTLGIGQGDEVIVPDLTFAASVNSIIYTGATPVLVDVDRETFNIDVRKIEEKITKKTKAIMPVHLYGCPCDMDAISNIAEKYNLLVIEDAAESFGSKYKNKYTGTFGDAACFSFFGNKTLTTGEGGMIIFKSSEMFEKARILRDHGMSITKKYWHEYVGYNYRMTNLQAAVGVAQIENVDSIINKKVELAKNYIDCFSHLPFINMVKKSPGIINTYWLFSVIIDPKFGLQKEIIQRKLLERGFETRNLFYPIHKMPPYQKYSGDGNFENSDYLFNNGLSFPSSTKVTKDEVKEICKVIFEMFEINNMHTYKKKNNDRE